MQIPKNDNNNDNNSKKESNADLIYSYTEALLKNKVDSLSRLDIKLNWIIAASGILLRFSIDLPTTSDALETIHTICYTCKLLKIILCVAATFAVIISMIGLTAKLKGKVPDPKDLMKSDLYALDNEYLKCRIINTWIQTEKEYLDIGKQKGEQLNKAIRLLCTAIVAFALDIVLVNAFSN
jgi:hypothetical protein